ncbi:MAG TPA: SemiSWEET transporter [Ginsengibacter sp.]|nr:SemiSWEET transporter [Ginsengibacter sp.]HRP17325.1 SemiSWEET transporter [Ginsengibacter sp.]HRP43943.1 SemiSWEET transporter [Ginsengibacter sp.]
MTFVTILGFIAAGLTTSSFIPQAVKTIRTNDTKSISLFMYLLFSTGTLLWLLFGIFSGNMPIIVANAITLVFAIIILIYKIRHQLAHRL